jgi:hypothetical protein
VPEAEELFLRRIYCIGSSLFSEMCNRHSYAATMALAGVPSANVWDRIRLCICHISQPYSKLLFPGEHELGMIFMQNSEIA